MRNRWAPARPTPADVRSRCARPIAAPTRSLRAADLCTCRYIDLKEHGNMMRLINDCHEAPNLQLMYWPELDLAKRVLPR